MPSISTRPATRVSQPAKSLSWTLEIGRFSAYQYQTMTSSSIGETPLPHLGSQTICFSSRPIGSQVKISSRNKSAFSDMTWTTSQRPSRSNSLRAQCLPYRARFHDLSCLTRIANRLTGAKCPSTSEKYGQSTLPARDKPPLPKLSFSMNAPCTDTPVSPHTSILPLPLRS